MTQLTAEQIARHAYKAGFRGHGLTTAVAVALAESGGNTKSHNAAPPDNSYGLWQINMLGAMGPERRRQYHLHSNNDLFNPDTNAKVAYSMSGHGKSWSPWSTYTGGAYRKYLSKASKAAHDVTQHHGKTTTTSSGSGGHHDTTTHKPSGGGGYAIDTDVVAAYTKQVAKVGHALTTVSDRTLHAVRGIAEDSFGKVGKETGFARALDDLGASLQRQVSGVGKNADTLGTSVTKAAKVFRGEEDDIVRAIGKIW
jgi:hypothetical protein